MHSVDSMISDILRREGGYVNHPNDRGGPTNHGVTQVTLSAWLGRPATVEEVKNLDAETAREIYERNYLTGPRIDTMPEPAVPFAFDAAVNHGPRNAVRMLQRVTNEAGFGPVSVDGLVGPKSRKAASRASQTMGDWFLAALCEERRNVYRRIIARDPTQAVFERGWMNRVDEFEPQISGRN